MSFDPIERTTLVLAAGSVAAACAFRSPAFALSLAAGAVLGVFNFRGLRVSAVAAFRGELSGPVQWNGLFALRFVVLAAGIGVATWAGADSIGLVVGLSVFIPAAFIEAWRARPAVDPDAPALAPDDEAWERWNPWLAREIEPRRDEDEDEDEDTDEDDA